MKTAGSENPNHGATLPHNRAHGAVGQNRFRSIRGGCEARKPPAAGEEFFLDFAFYRTYQELAPVGLIRNQFCTARAYEIVDGKNLQCDCRDLGRFQRGNVPSPNYAVAFLASEQPWSHHG
jgi:hypothetical protein